MVTTTRADCDHWLAMLRVEGSGDKHMDVAGEYLVINLLQISRGGRGLVEVKDMDLIHD